MGSALLQGWLNSNIEAQFVVIDPHTPEKFKNHPGVYWCAEEIGNCPDVIEPSDMFVFAIKPQIIEEACMGLGYDRDCCMLSIAAGKSLSYFENFFGNTQPIIRAMPNTPAAIGKGMSIAIANSATTDEQKFLAAQLLETAGQLEWIDDESLMDAVTALSGSGPAYVFYLIEMLASAGTKAGLPEDMATTLARQTVIGAAALAEADPQTGAATLRQNVTSPGGTTEAALNILMDGTVQDVFDKALEAATTRSKELNS